MKIEVFDNQVPFAVREKAFDYCSRANFSLGWTDRPVVDHEKSVPNVYASWSQEQLDASGIFTYIAPCIEETAFFTSRRIESAVVNLVRPSDVHYIHSHPGKQVALYYCNLDWEDGWYGETLFHDPKDLNRISFASAYTPGRIILFDGSIPHAIRPQSINGPKYRISVTVLLCED